MSNGSLLKLTPDGEISFPGRDFNDVQTQVLNCANSSKSSVAIKIKTTAVKAYLVKPSSAVLKPGESTNVTIMLQKLSDNPSSGQHKFLVQAVPCDLPGPISKEQWTELASKNPTTDYRLTVVFPNLGVGGGSAKGGQVEKSQSTSKTVQQPKSSGGALNILIMLLIVGLAVVCGMVAMESPKDLAHARQLFQAKIQVALAVMKGASGGAGGGK